MKKLFLCLAILLVSCEERRESLKLRESSIERVKFAIQGVDGLSYYIDTPDGNARCYVINLGTSCIPINEDQ